MSEYYASIAKDLSYRITAGEISIRSTKSKPIIIRWVFHIKNNLVRIEHKDCIVYELWCCKVQRAGLMLKEIDQAEFKRVISLPPELSQIIALDALKKQTVDFDRVFFNKSPYPNTVEMLKLPKSEVFPSPLYYIDHEA